MNQLPWKIQVQNCCNNTPWATNDLWTNIFSQCHLLPSPHRSSRKYVLWRVFKRQLHLLWRKENYLVSKVLNPFPSKSNYFFLNQEEYSMESNVHYRSVFPTSNISRPRKQIQFSKTTWLTAFIYNIMGATTDCSFQPLRVGDTNTFPSFRLSWFSHSLNIFASETSLSTDHKMLDTIPADEL